MVPFDLNVEMQNGIIMNFFAKNIASGLDCQQAVIRLGHS